MGKMQTEKARELRQILPKLEYNDEKENFHLETSTDLSKHLPFFSNLKITHLC